MVQARVFALVFERWSHDVELLWRPAATPPAAALGTDRDDLLRVAGSS